MPPRFRRLASASDYLRPELSGRGEFELEVSKLYGRPLSELAATLDSRDWAFLRLSWDRHGTLEALSVSKDRDG